jgi:hypothetical protein
MPCFLRTIGVLAGNQFEIFIVGADMESSESSAIGVSHNVSSGISTSMDIVSVWPAFVPSNPSQYLIHEMGFDPWTLCPSHLSL